jgi:hypothetical protein
MSTKYHVEVFRQFWGQEGRQDMNEYDDIEDAKTRLEELQNMSGEELTKLFGYSPSLGRIVSVAKGE